MAEALIDRQFLERLERLTIHWQKSFPGLVGGHNASRFSGSGQEFLDHRSFHQGDDLRAVNWRAYMRLERLILKMFQVEPRVPVRFLVDASSSMATGDPDKFDYARKLAAALCYVGLVRLETILIQPFRDYLLDPITAGGGRHRFQPVAEYLSKTEAGGKTDFLKVSRQFLAEYPQRGLLILISDFLDDRDAEKPLQYLSDFGHEVFLIHLWSEQDRRPPWTGEVEVEDAETGLTVKMNFDDEAREYYTTAFDSYAASVRQMALRKGGKYVGVPTSTPVEEAIFGPLMLARGIY